MQQEEVRTGRSEQGRRRSVSNRGHSTRPVSPAAAGASLLPLSPTGTEEEEVLVII